MGRLENTLRHEEARIRLEKATRRAQHADSKLCRAKVLELAHALKRERRVFRQYRAEVTTGHCIEVVKRIVMAQKPDGSEKFYESRKGVDFWICAIRWPDTSYENVWIKKLDITFAAGEYRFLKSAFTRRQESGKTKISSQSADLHKDTGDGYEIQLMPIGADVDTALEAIAKEFAGTNADYLYSFSGLTIEKPKSAIRQRLFQRRWDL